VIASVDRTAFEPLAADARSAPLDAVRGVALLGIALMNVEFFARPLQGMLLGFDSSLDGLDYAVGWFIAAFVQGKFWTLFSLLFGMGYALMLGRADTLPADPDFHRVYARRLALLLLFGLLHTTLLWAGDILVSYALGGFVLLLLFRNTPTRQLPLVGLLLYWIPCALLWMGAAVFTLAQLHPESGAAMGQDAAAATEELQIAYAEAARVYREGGYFDAVGQRLRDTAMMLQWLPMMLPAIVGVFLIGMWFVRSGVMPAPTAHWPLLRRLFWIGGPIGAVMATLAMRHLEHADMLQPTLGLAAATTAMMAASLLLCLAYFAALMWMTSVAAPALGAWLAPAGRMALSNYLLQSLLFSTLFYGYGFGWSGEVGRAQQAGLVLVVFLLQLVASRWWLARFRHGPMEWLWRFGTYGRRPSLRRE
jgi:uncharacterized protein